MKVVVVVDSFIVYISPDPLVPFASGFLYIKLAFCHMIRYNIKN